MSNTPDMSSFGKFVPGFDFLQNLAKQAAGSTAPSIPQLPNLGNWVAPTLSVEELDKRIEELKAVQFWLDQNAMALKATIQALEVQKMTLATLKGMNFNFGDVANAFKLKPAEKAPDAATTMGSLAGSILPKATSATAASSTPSGGESAKSEEGAAGVIDPMQWWGALTQQFGQIAATAMKDAAKQTALDTTQGVAKEAFKKVSDMANSMTGGMSAAVSKAVAGSKTAAKKTAAKKTAAKKAPAKKRAQ